jgi:alpha-1,3-glucan synthase
MYVIMDNTVATLSDLLGFEGYLNASAPFKPAEHNVVWKTDRRYYDFKIGDKYNETCDSFPRFWNETGYEVDQWVYDQFKGCYDGEFDQVCYALAVLTALTGR